VSRVCAHCGGPLKTRQKKYCCLWCRVSDKKNEITRTCEQCGEPFQALPSRVAKGQARFCSQECCGLANIKPRKYTHCQNPGCGKELGVRKGQVNRKYCGQMCASRASGLKRKGISKPFPKRKPEPKVIPGQSMDWSKLGVMI